MPPSASDAYNSLQSFNATRETPQAAADAGAAKYGTAGLASQLDQLRGLTGNLTTAISNVAPSVAGRTSGSLVTEAQRNAITNNETQPLAEQLTKVGQQQADVGSRYNDAQNLASNYANSLLGDDQQKYQQLFGQYTTLAGQEADAAKLAEQKREFDANLAQSKAAAVGAAGLGGLGGGAASTLSKAAAPTPQAQLMSDIQRLLPTDYATKFTDGYTERLIANLQKAYPELANQIPNIVYNYRKPFEAAPTKAASAPALPSGKSQVFGALGGGY